MIPLLIKILPIWSWLKANPLLCLCAMLALWGGWERHQAHKWQSRAIACQTASDAARKAQEALRAQERAKYQEQARHADQAYAAAIADARNATDAFIRAHRLRGGVIAPVAIGQASDAGQPQDMPAAVVVDEADVRRCGDWQAYGIALHDWALTITEPAK
jgi:hypothetical protein